MNVYTTVVMVDLDALGLADVDRVRVSDVLYEAVLKARETLLAFNSEPVASLTPQPTKEPLPYELPEPPAEDVKEVFAFERTYYLTFRRSGKRRHFLSWDEIEMVLSEAMDDLGREHAPDNSLLLKLGPETELRTTYWLAAPKLPAESA